MDYLEKVNYQRKCPYCGENILDSTVICSRCGGQVKAVKIQKDSSPIYAILALIGGFLFGILGIPFGIAGLKIYKRKMERNFCWTGIILGAIWIVADIVMTIVYASLLL